MSELDDFLSDFDRDAPPKPSPRPDLDDPRVGFFPDMTPEEYFADPIEEGSLSNSGISILLAETPMDFACQHPRLNPDAIEDARKSAAVLRGDIVHQLALGKGRGYAVGDFKDWRTKAAQSFREEAEAAGKTPVLIEPFEAAEVMAEILRERFEEVLDGAEYFTECPIIWREDTPAGTIYMRGMLDVWCPSKGIILDPKISERLYDGPPGKHVVSNHAVAMGWDRQAALYSRGVGRLMPQLEGRVRFGNIMVKPKAPFTSRLLWPDETMTISALAECRPAMLRFAECMKTGAWPSFPVEGEPLSLAPWEERRRLDKDLAV